MHISSFWQMENRIIRATAAEYLNLAQRLNSSFLFYQTRFLPKAVVLQGSVFRRRPGGLIAADSPQGYLGMDREMHTLPNMAIVSNTISSSSGSPVDSVALERCPHDASNSKNPGDSEEQIYPPRHMLTHAQTSPTSTVSPHTCACVYASPLGLDMATDGIIGHHDRKRRSCPPSSSFAANAADLARRRIGIRNDNNFQHHPVLLYTLAVFNMQTRLASSTVVFRLVVFASPLMFAWSKRSAISTGRKQGLMW